MGCKKNIDWQKYPRRHCVWLNTCRICKKDIISGQGYFDGGYGIRAHIKCVEKPSQDSTALAFLAIQNVRSHYPENVFLENNDGLLLADTQDAKSAQMARLICDNVKREFEILLDEGEAKS
jgi:hypothetical protein